jgi:NADPH:quinone reductase-like Zn-dependent oxidoreductase
MSVEATTGNWNGFDARALWIEGPRIARLREVTLRAPGPSEALVATQWSCISRGTERLVFEGRVPDSEMERMRAPLQEGSFSFPIKYGYCAVGRILAGPSDWLSRDVFCLHPHQNYFVAQLDMLHVLPSATAPRRAALAANMETALNALWDAGAGPGDRIVVIGAGVVGLLIAALCARLPGAELTVVDVEPSRACAVEAIGAKFVQTKEFEATCKSDADVVFHTSASGEGLALALACAGVEGSIVELSWYGDAEVGVPLGREFHANRLRLISSQVGRVSPSRRLRWSSACRLKKALELLADPCFDALVSEEVAFDDLPRELPRILASGAPGLATVVHY